MARSIRETLQELDAAFEALDSRAMSGEHYADIGTKARATARAITLPAAKTTARAEHPHVFDWSLTETCKLHVRVFRGGDVIRIEYAVSGDPPSGDLWVALLNGRNRSGWLWANLGAVRSGVTTVAPKRFGQSDPVASGWKVRFHLEAPEAPVLQPNEYRMQNKDEIAQAIGYVPRAYDLYITAYAKVSEISGRQRRKYEALAFRFRTYDIATAYVLSIAAFERARANSGRKDRQRIAKLKTRVASMNKDLGLPPELGIGMTLEDHEARTATTGGRDRTRGSEPEDARGRAARDSPFQKPVGWR